MSDIEWKEGAVFYARAIQFGAPSCTGSSLYPAVNGGGHATKDCFERSDFQLNEPREGYYIPKSELDTEEKYNQVLEVFGLFGFKLYLYNKGYSELVKSWSGVEIYQGVLASTNNANGVKLTFPQLMAIGELKREMIKREKSAPKTAPDLTPDIGRKTAVEYLQGCIDVQKERGEQYDANGTGERSFDAAAKAFNALTGRDLKGSDVCLLFTCVKAVRQYSNPDRLHEDSLLDSVSYLSLWAEELNKELV